jgi:hypothetical protein
MSFDFPFVRLFGVQHNNTGTKIGKIVVKAVPNPVKTDGAC